jgi:hypothetical protein
MRTLSSERRILNDEHAAANESLSEFESESEFVDSPPSVTAQPATSFPPPPKTARLTSRQRDLLGVLGLLVLAFATFKLGGPLREWLVGSSPHTNAIANRVLDAVPVGSFGPLASPVDPVIPAVRSLSPPIAIPNPPSQRSSSRAPLVLAPTARAATPIAVPGVVSPAPARTPLAAESSLALPVPADAPTESTAEAAPAAPLARSGIEIESAAVRAVLARYETALEELDVASTAEVWPSVDRTMLSRAFSTLKWQGITFESCVLAITDTDATVRCNGSVWFVPKIGRSEPRGSEQHWVFSMKKFGNDWKIADVAATVSQPTTRTHQQQR